MKYESDTEKHVKFVLLGLLLIFALCFYWCTGNSDPLHHCLLDSAAELLEHIR